VKIVSLQEVVTNVRSGDRIFFQGAAMTPNLLIDELCERYRELKDIEIIQIHTHGAANYLNPPYNKSFRLNSCFVGANVRKGVDEHCGDYIPIFLSEIHLLFEKQRLPLDVAFIQVSPPDKHGYCSLGTSVDVSLAALNAANMVIASTGSKDSWRWNNTYR
jgi:acyl-CoA hydrolase